MARRPDGPVLCRAAARYRDCATAAGAAQLEVFLTGTARTSQSFGESDPAQDRNRGPGLYHLNGPPARWPCPEAAARYGATAAGAAQLEVFLIGTARTCQCFGESDPAQDRIRGPGLYHLNGQRAQWPCPEAAAWYGATAAGAAQLEVFLIGTARMRLAVLQYLHVDLGYLHAINHSSAASHRSIARTRENRSNLCQGVCYQR